MRILQLDLFSSEFYFNLEGQRFRKGTFIGLLLSLFTITVAIYYFIYLMNLYVNNQIDPKFRWQSFVMNQRIDLPINQQDLIGFQYFYNNSLNLNQYQMQMNQTYLVYIAQFYYQDPANNMYQTIQLDLIECSSPQLIGYYCLDLSKIHNYTLALDNFNNLYSMLTLYIYGCRDIDSVKTAIPNNCASQSEIDQLANGVATFFNIKLQVQQYNTTSKQIQSNYRNLYVYLQSSQSILSTLRTQKQETKVSQGLLFQTEELYQSPISYTQNNQNFDRQVSLLSGSGPYAQVSLQLDEIVQQFQIQYPTITEILALFNSITSIIVISRFLGRYYSFRLIKQDFFMLVFRNIFQQKNEQILKHNNILQQQQETQPLIPSLRKEESIEKDDEQIINQTNKNTIPNFKTKFKCYVDQSQKNPSTLKQQNLNESYYQKDEILVTNSQTDSPNSKFIQSSLQTTSSKFNLIKNQQLETQSQKLKRSNIKKKVVNENIDLNKNNTKKQTYPTNMISDKLKTINDNSMKQSVQKFIFKFKLFKVKEFLQSKGIDEESLKKIDKDVQNNLNIYELFKDILFLKKAIMMLLSEDQLAAIQLVSLTDNYLSLNLSNSSFKHSYKKIQTKLNHYEKQSLIYQSEELKIDCIEQFIQKCQDTNEINEIDQRIRSSVFTIQ